MDLNTILLLLLVTLAEILGFNQFVLDTRPKRCQYERSYGMNGAVCHGLNLRTVPTNLKSNIEILDASYNRIRELYKTSFINYGYLKMVYLEDNMIMYIENGTFTPLQNLEVIDLSSNSLNFVPRELLTLPNLRKLYMNNNRLMGSAGLINSPPSQSLEFLSLAKCYLAHFPPLEGYPFLKNLNLSGNEIRTLSTDHLAPMCLLQSLDLTNNPYMFQERRQDGVCDCIVVESWIEKREIYMPKNFKFNCTTNKYGETAMCINATYSERTIELYESCIQMMRKKQEIAETRNTWILVVVILTCSLLTVFLVLFWIHKRNQKKAKLKKKNNSIIRDNGDSEEKMVSKYENGSDVDS